jgi:ankyrin repeat protein
MVDTSFSDQRRSDGESWWRVILSIPLCCVFADLHDRFRWVECQFRSLKSCPRNEDHLEKLLESLPQSLDETYERMLLNIDAASTDYARRILMWLCFSKRPLTVPELIDGIAVELGDHARLNRKRRLFDESDLLQICPGLISIAFDSKKRSKVVSIAHFSVQEYLESDRLHHPKVAFFSMSGANSHIEIAQTCLVYLLDPSLLNAEVSPSTLKELPLLRYAARYWYKHVKGDDPLFPQIHSFVLQLFENRSYAFRNWIQIHDPDVAYDFLLRPRTRKAATPTYYSSLLGLHSVLCVSLTISNGDAQTEVHGKLLLDKDSDVNAQGGVCGKALQAASLNGHEKVVQLLLDKNADVNAQGGKYGNALYAASINGHEKVVQLLLDKNADVNAQGGKYGNALYAASMNGHEKVVQLLLGKEADVNAQGGDDGSALCAAEERIHEKIKQLVLEMQANVTAQGGTLVNALQSASICGHENALQLLLGENADVNAQGEGCLSALYAASFAGYEKVVQLLLDKDANVNTQFEQYGNAFQAACEKGHEKVVQLLLDKDADVNAPGGRYGNALQAACEGGHEKVVQLLLDKDADVNAPGGRYGNALQAALHGGHEKVVLVLVQSGLDFNAGFERLTSTLCRVQLDWKWYYFPKLAGC